MIHLKSKFHDGNIFQLSLKPNSFLEIFVYVGCLLILNLNLYPACQTNDAKIDTYLEKKKEKEFHLYIYKGNI